MPFPLQKLRRLWPILPLLLALGAGAAGLGPKLMRRYYHPGLTLVPVAQGLEAPWSIAFLPDGRLLVTERPGRMRLVGRGGQVSAPLAGLPPVYAEGEGGLLDVVLDPGFARNQRVYWSYSEPDAANAGLASTAVARGRLADGALHEVQVIFRQPDKTADGRHFGSRLLFAPDGRLFIGLGDRMQRDDAQLPASAHGKIVRIEADGSVPEGNAYPGASGAQAAVWTLGHRNVQGLAFDPATGRLWESEHGPSGGDEINLIERGRNYGWPVITYGCEYDTCAKIGVGTAQAGMEQPAAWFGPKSLPLAGMSFITSARYPQWQGQLLVATLSSPTLMRLKVEGDRVLAREPMWLGPYRRVRDVKQGPDGWLYVVANLPEGSIVRLER